MAEQDTLYFELQEALQSGGCPLCRLGGRAAARYMDTLTHEGITDPGLRQALQDARGLCRRHAWEWSQMRGSPLGIAIVYESLLGDVIRVLEGQGSTATRSRSARREIRTQLAAGAPCPACRVEDAAVRRYGQTLLVHLDQPAFAEAYVEAGGLCLLHLRTVLAQADDGQSAILQAWQLESYRGLQAELAEFIRKHDHRFRDEPFDAERDSWRRAVAALTGEPDGTA